MKEVKPQETIIICDVCGKKMVDYADYNKTIRCKLKRRRRAFSFFKKEMIDYNEFGLSYDYKELYLCGRCYDKMMGWVTNEIKKGE